MKNLLALLLLMAADAAWGGLVVTPAPGVLNSARGQSLVFTGTMAYAGTGGDLYLNGITIGGTASGYLAPGPNSFYFNVPGVLKAGETYTGELFGVALGGDAPAADYTGSVTLLGGTDIFASGTLATFAFTVLSPSVSIVAAADAAAKLGPAGSAFTIARTGGTSIALPVVLSFGGAAVPGGDYQYISAASLIAAGASDVVIPVTPIASAHATGDVTVSCGLVSSTLYDTGSPLSASVVIHDTPFNNWRIQYFGAAANTPAGAASGDYSGSGISNLEAYALGMVPIAPRRALLPYVGVSGGYLTLTYTPSASAPDVTCTVEASTDLVNWSSANVQSIVSGGAPGSVAWRYGQPLGASPRVFMRLRVAGLGN